MATISGSAPFPIVSTQDNALGSVGAVWEMVKSFNGLVDGIQNMLIIQSGDGPVTTGAPSIGTTVTMASAAQIITIAGVPVLLAAETAKAFGSLGTIPTATWGLIAVDRIANGTTSFVSAAANYTTGYATEALAIAAAPAKTANKARTGYITILATTPGWVAGTDALAGGTGGTPATTTHYWNNFVNGTNQGLGYADLVFWTLTSSTTSGLITSAVTNTVQKLGNLGGSEYIAGGVR